MEKANARLGTIGKIITKLYQDNANGKLNDENLYTMVADLQRESVTLKQQIAELEKENEDDRREENYRKFFSMVKQHTVIDELDEDTLRTFVERIEVGPKELPEGVQIATHRNQPYRQKIRIVYRFIGELTEEPERQFPIAANQ